MIDVILFMILVKHVTTIEFHLLFKTWSPREFNLIKHIEGSPLKYNSETFFIVVLTSILDA